MSVEARARRDPKYHAIAVKRLTAAREQLELCP